MLHGDIYDLKIPELRDDFRFLLGETRLDDALAAINPTQPSSHVLPKPPIYDLTRFEVSNDSENPGILLIERLI